MRYLLLPLLLLSLTLTAAEEKKPAADKKAAEATVSVEKKADGTAYTITIQPPFKINREAPFKFELRKNEQELIRKVDLAEFKKDEKSEIYQYFSTAGEKRFHYWFIACKYKGDEVIACKTFTAKQDLP